MDQMIKIIDKYPNGTYLVLDWEKEGLEIEGTIETMYESDNGLEEDEEGYLEYYACAVKVCKINHEPSDNTVKPESLIEISEINKPSLMKLKDGTVIWREGD